MRADPELESRLDNWINRHLAGYTGMLNLETIGGSIVDVHLRVSDQWPDLYEPGWVDAVVALYQCGQWRLANHDLRDG